MSLSDFAAAVPEGLLSRSGKLVYAGAAAFEGRREVYVLGINPGGDPVAQARETVAASLAQAQAAPRWNAYLDESWAGRPPGEAVLQRRLRGLFDRLGLDLRDTPASNVVFERSRTERDLRGRWAALVEACWGFHAAVIDGLGVRMVVCLGGSAGRAVRARLGARAVVAEFREGNARGLRSWVHEAPSGVRVATLTHPGRADWGNAAADPVGVLRDGLG
ncbi:MAG: hypothetical protein AAF192_06840 [Pseudomonadota bacterium]